MTTLDDSVFDTVVPTHDPSYSARALPLGDNGGDGAYQRTLTAYRSWLWLPDTAVLETELAATLVNLYDDPAEPIWLMYVAPPAGAKTEQIAPLSAVDGVHMLSTLTATALVSGQKKAANGPEPSLLRRLPSVAQLVVKDFTTLLSMQRDARAEVIAQLREIYDGSFSKEFGNGVHVEWKGKLGVLAAVTPIIDNHHAVGSVLGERFLTVRLRDNERREAARQGLLNVGHEQQMRHELGEAVKDCISRVADRKAPPVPEKYLDRIIDLADMAVRGRAGVVRNAYSDRRIDYVPDTELPTRMAKQLAGLWRGLHRLHGADPGLELITRVALDAIPDQRRRVFDVLARHENWVTTDQVGESAGGATGIGRIPRSTAKMVLEELWSLGIVDRQSEALPTGPREATRWSWKLSARAQAVWTSDLVTPLVQEVEGSV